MNGQLFPQMVTQTMVASMPLLKVQYLLMKSSYFILLRISERVWKP